MVNNMPLLLTYRILGVGGPNFSYKKGQNNSWDSSEAKQAITNKLSESLEFKQAVGNKRGKIVVTNKSFDFLKLNE